MTVYFKSIFWNVTKLKVLLYEFTEDFFLHQGDAGISVGRYHVYEMYCYVDLYRPMCGYIKQSSAVERWHA